MSKQRDRDEFISIMAQEHVPVDVARALLRAGATLHRLAELSCSSEAADRDRVRCPDAKKQRPQTIGVSCLCRDYGSFKDGAHGTVPRIAVQEAQIEARVEKLCKAHNLAPVFGGDPRGAVLLVKVPSGRTNDWGQRGVVVA